MKSAGDESADVMSAGPPIAFTYSDSYSYLLFYLLLLCYSALVLFCPFIIVVLGPCALFN